MVLEQLCFGCYVQLFPPYIQCTLCKRPEPTSPDATSDTDLNVVNLCLHCFAKGFEKGKHESNHPYTIIRNDFVLMESGWTALEELQFLDAIAKEGIGNWLAVARNMTHKTSEGCDSHYNKCYITNPCYPLPEFPWCNKFSFSATPLPCTFSEDPPRPTTNTTWWQDLAGYDGAKSEFAVEYDNFAEYEMAELNFDSDSDANCTDLLDKQTKPSEDKKDDLLNFDLKMTVIDVYLNRLRERWRRHRILRRYGLINIHKHKALEQRRYGKMLGCTVLENLIPFMKLLPPAEYDKLLESLHYETQLRTKIQKLLSYREEGIKHLRSAAVYEHLKSRKSEKFCKKKMLDKALMLCRNASHSWLENKELFLQSEVRLPNSPRRPAPPLHIVGLPSYEKLSISERELCSTCRLLPESFLTFKDVLLTEYNKNGYLKLAQARQLIKIDVNKTRQIYNLLLENGEIRKDPVL